jgi:hypothetical protein
VSKICISSLLFLLCFGACQGRAQTDVAASVYGAFNSSAVSGKHTQQVTTISPSSAAGVLLEFRHISNPLVGYEFTYSFNRANQAYSKVTPTPPCPAIGALCGPITTRAAVPANAHEFTADWVASLKFASFRPFVLAGGGLLVTVPGTGSVPAVVTICDRSGSPCSSGTTSIPTSTHVTGVFVYGAGLDWSLLPHIGLRFQYRGNVYKAPELAEVFSSASSFTHNAEPVAGVFFRF